MEPKDTLSSCSYSDEQDMQQMLKRAKILKGSCLNSLSALKSNFTRKLEQGITKSEFERAFSHIFGEDVDTFTRTFSQNMDTLEQQLTKETILESNCQNAFRVLKTQFEKIFTSMLIKPSSLDEDKAQERCMVSYRLLHSYLKLLSNNDLKGTRTEYGFKRAFATLFGQDLETFIGRMFLNMDKLEKQLDNEEFQDIGSMDSFKVLEIQFQMFIKSRIYLDDEYVVMIRNYFLQYTQLEILEFHDTLIQHMESVKKSILKKGNMVNFKSKKHYKELSDSIKTTRAKTIEHTTSLIAKNDEYKAQLQEKGFAISALKNELRKLTGNSVNAKFAKSSILGKPFLQPHRNQSVVGQPTAFKRTLEFQSHGLPPKYSSNDMVHNHYLEEAKKKTQESGRNSRPSVMPSARSQSTANGSKPKSRINNQKSRIWHLRLGGFLLEKYSHLAQPRLTTNGSNEDISNQYECEQTLDVSADTLNLSACTSFNPKKEGLKVCPELGIHDHSNEPSSSKLGFPKGGGVAPPATRHYISTKS
ncbi:hypothetical protein Tco_1117760 [Tanacetum coccineum]